MSSQNTNSAAGWAVAIPGLFSSPSPPLPSSSHCPPPSHSHHPQHQPLDHDPGFPPFDCTFLGIPAVNRRHVRSSSQASPIYSVLSLSSVDAKAESPHTHLSTPPRATSPVRHHGPFLLPKIRSQDQHVDRAGRPASVGPSPKSSSRATTSPRTPWRLCRPSRHVRSYTSPNCLADVAAYPPIPPCSLSNRLTDYFVEDRNAGADAAPLLCSPANLCFPITLRAPPAMLASVYYIFNGYYFQSIALDIINQDPRDRGPYDLQIDSSPDEMSSVMMTLIEFLTLPNPPASLVRTISFPLRDPSLKYFWWDVRSVRSWDSFNASTVFALPGVSSLLTARIPACTLPQPKMSYRHPDTEASLYTMYASYYLPKLNAALSISSAHPLRITVPAKTPVTNKDLVFTVHADGDLATAAVLFGGKPSGLIVGIVRSFDRFNTGMRVEDNIKRVEYLRGLAALHHLMREHGCRYGFILTEIELVVVRSGTDVTPVFGDLDVTSVRLAVPRTESNATDMAAEIPWTACLALWGLCQLAAGDAPPGHAHWALDIGAPVEGTRRKARPRDVWMPQTQLAEKREAKRARGWVWPEDAICRKELGKRGVIYSAL